MSEHAEQLKKDKAHDFTRQPSKSNGTSKYEDNSAASTQLKRHQAMMNANDSKQNASPPNGLPWQLKRGIESLSGHNMDDVVLHRNSSAPAQLNAHAFARGNEIHLAPGQEKHLPHEAWHIAQQKQGRVKPTLQLKNKVAINDDSELESEADIMGEKAMNLGQNELTDATQLKTTSIKQGVAQCVLNYNNPIIAADIVDIKQLGGKLLFKLTGNNQDAVIVKAETIGGGETIGAFRARNSAIDMLGEGILPNVPQASSLSPEDIQAIQACNIPNNQALQLLHTILAVPDRDTTLLLLKKECKDVGSENMDDITKADKQNVDAANNASRLKKTKQKLSNSLKAPQKTRSQILLEDASIMLSLGTCAAFDLFIGNEDRFTETDVNLENIDFDSALKQVVALDQLNPTTPIIHIGDGPVAWKGRTVLESRAQQAKYAVAMYQKLLSSAGLTYKSSLHDSKIQAFVAGMETAVLKLIDKKVMLKYLSGRKSGLNDDEKLVCKTLLQRIELLG